MSKHTPGPWTFKQTDERDDDQGGEHCIYAPDGSVIAQTNYDTLDRKNDRPTYQTSEADARLIAAAPDLLQAIRAMLGMDNPAAPDLGHVDYVRAVSMARAAVARAEGK